MTQLRQCCTLLCLPLFHGCSSSDSVVLSCVCHCFMVAPAQTVLYSLVSAIVSWLLQLRQCCTPLCLPLFHGCSSSDSVVLSCVCHCFMVAPAQTVLSSPVSAIVSWLLQLRQCCPLQCLPLFHGCSSSDSVVLSSVCHCFIVAPAHCCTLQCLPLFHGWSS